MSTMLGSRIRQARREARLSQSELGRKITAHVTSVSDWERGIHEPGIRHLTSIARETGKPLDWFVEARAPFLDGAAA